MPAKIRKSVGSKPAKVPSNRWPDLDVIQVAVEVNSGITANVALKGMLERNIALLAEFNQTVASYDKPGQTMSAIRSEMDRRAKKDETFRKAALEADVWEPALKPTPRAPEPAIIRTLEEQAKYDAELQDLVDEVPEPDRSAELAFKAQEAREAEAN